MWPRKAPVVASLLSVTLVVISNGCGQSSAPPDARSFSEAVLARDHEAPATAPAGDSRVLAMLEQSLGPSRMRRSAAAVLAASDLATASPARAVDAIDLAIRVTVDNLENAETTAFKARIARLNGEARPDFSLDMTQGTMAQTGGPLDVAISGGGFLPVKIDPSQGTNGIGYTRNGSLTVNSLGNLVLYVGDGYQLVPPITVPTDATNVNIGSDGTVMYVKPGSTVKTTAGQIKLAVFPNPQGINLLGGSIYTESPASGRAVLNYPGRDGAATIISGFLEQSNVSVNVERARLRQLYDWRDVLLQVIDRPYAAARRLNSDAATMLAASGSPPSIAAIHAAMDEVTNNLDNAGTLAFKAAVVKMTGGKPDISLDMSPGSRELTKIALDVFIDGQGFIAVKVNDAPGGVGYTRFGSFTVDAFGSLVLAEGEGRYLAPPISFPVGATDISIAADGTVTYIKPGAKLRTECGQFKLARFPHPQRLTCVGGNIYAQSEASGEPEFAFPGFNGVGRFVAGYLETSNVSIVRDRERLRFLREWRDAISGLATRHEYGEREKNE